MKAYYLNKDMLLPVLFAALVWCATGLITPVGVEAQSDVTTVVFVRHAEKDSLPTDDPQLTAQGRTRARALAATLEKAGVVSIVTTQYTRTKETATPLADALGLGLTSIPALKDSLNPKKIAQGSYDAVIQQIRNHTGGTILVVGHSNTVPEMIRMLGGPGDITIPEDVFDRMYVMFLKGKDVMKVMTLRYGDSR